MSARGIEWMLVVIIVAAGCHRSATTPTENATAVVSVANDAVTTPEEEFANVDPKRMSPNFRKRSPEKLRQRIRDTVARMQADTEPRQRRQALQRVANAVLQYQQQHGSLPADSPQLSWRVAVLPFLGEDRLHREFHQKEPWNSPHNEALVTRMPKVLGDDPLGLTRCFLASENKSSGVLLFEGSENDQIFWTQPAEQPVATESPPRRIVLRDGTVCEFDVNVSVDAWRKWLSRESASSETPEWLRRFSARTMVQEFSAGSLDESAGPLRPTLPVEAWGVLHLEPRRLLRNPHVHAVVQNALAEPDPMTSTTVLQSMLGPYGSQLRTILHWMKERGVDPLRLESQTVVIPSVVWNGPVVGAELFAVVCRAPAPFDVEGLITHEFELSAAYQFREQGSSAGIIDLRRSFAWHFSDDATALFGGQTLVASLSEAQPNDSRLTAMWDVAGNAPAAMFVDCVPLQSFMQQQVPVSVPFLREAIPSLRDATEIVLALDPDSFTWGTLSIFFREAQAARNVHATVSSQIDEERKRLIQRDSTEPLSIREEWWAELLAGLQCECEGERLQLTITRPQRWEALLQQLITRAGQKY